MLSGITWKISIHFILYKHLDCFLFRITLQNVIFKFYFLFFSLYNILFLLTHNDDDCKLTRLCFYYLVFLCFVIQFHCVCLDGYHGNGTYCVMNNICEKNNGGCYPEVCRDTHTHGRVHVRTNNYDLYFLNYHKDNIISIHLNYIFLWLN